MGLDPSYDTVRTSILSLDPLPSLNSVYSQLLRVEKQKKLSILTSLPLESTALAVNTYVPSSSGHYNLKRNKRDLSCTFCGKRGHDSSECFKRLKKVPDWYKELQAKKAHQSAAHFVNANPEDPLCYSDAGILPTPTAPSASNVQLTPALLEALFQKYVVPSSFRAPVTSDLPPPADIPVHFAGTLLPSSYLCLSSSDSLQWIIDTGATDHMCPFLHHFYNIRTLSTPIKISLPTGQQLFITTIGDIPFTSTIVLKDVFYVPTFQ
ncbi:hypothetical protein RND81_10G205000 [Saponaria officinalis]|uniref:CCHC-type domain-containing protein n=1 Tax=Saponaria officinalis TaxID=3572 RepID=A0AAW1I4Q5_SAPOF